MKKLLLLAAIIVMFGAHFAHAQAFMEKSEIVVEKVSKNKKYGYLPTRKHSIKVGSIPNEKQFLACLCGPNGESLSCVRLGSGWPFETENSWSGKGFLDKWQITYEGCTEQIILYINGYDYDTPKCPVGLRIKEKIKET